MTCLLKNTEDWCNRLDLGMLVRLVIIDLKKAFDTVEIVSRKLKYYGILIFDTLDLIFLTENNFLG